MPKGLSLIELRNAIEEVGREVMREHRGEATNEQILSRVRTRNASEIERLTDKLVNIALTKLLNDVSNRKGPKVIRGGADLFGEYQGIRRNVALGKGRKKDTTQLTIKEAELLLRNRDAIRDDRNESFKRLVEDCRSYAESDEDTLAVALERKLKRERPELGLGRP